MKLTLKRLLAAAAVAAPAVIMLVETAGHRAP